MESADLVKIYVALALFVWGFYGKYVTDKICFSLASSYIKSDMMYITVAYILIVIQQIL